MRLHRLHRLLARVTRILGLTVLLIICTLHLTGVPSSSVRPEFLTKPEGSIRLMSYNPYWNSIFRTGIRRYRKADQFERVLAAVQPDVVCLQEVGPEHDTKEIAAIFDSALPLYAGAWHVARGVDDVIVSRFPIAWSVAETADGLGSFARGHVIALVLPDDSFGDEPIGGFGDGLLVVGAHFRSGGSEAEVRARTNHADLLVAGVRRVVADHELPRSVPLVIAGDLNAYDTDPRRHLLTLVSGNIADEKRYGPDGSLDPSGAPLADLLPSHNDLGVENWTWRDDTQEFDPFPLDRILYSSSTIQAVHSFVLDTAILGADELAATGLEADDVALDLGRGNYDHLPLVADFVPTEEE